MLSTLMLSTLPYGSIGTMLNALKHSFNSWFGAGTIIIGYAVCFCGIVGILLAINAIRKQQPSTKYWLVGILSLIFGGFLLGGFSNFKSTAEGQGQDSLDKAITGGGDTTHN